MSDYDHNPRNGVPINEPYTHGPRHPAPPDSFAVGPGYPIVPKNPRKVWPWIVGFLILVLAACGIGSVLVLTAGAKAVNDETQGQKADVTMVPKSCLPDGDGFWKAKVKITNSGKSDRSYWVQVNLDRGPTRLGEGHAVVNNLKPGQTVTQDVTGGGTFVKGAVCTIGDVN